MPIAAGVAAIILLGAGLAGAIVMQRLTQPTAQPAATASPGAQGDLPTTSEANTSSTDAVSVVAENLTIPWAIDWLPGGELLVTERPGTLSIMGPDRKTIPITGVEHVGEGGLQGLAVHPQYAENNYIYLYLTTKSDARLTNRVDRYVLVDNNLSDRTTIIDDIPGAGSHDGGRIAFGPDDLLYVTIGDATDEDAAQDPISLNGTILRVHDDGSALLENPFASLVYSYGHRNPQGITWDNLGRLWATEHGRSGSASGLDELNIITPGGNYGWPVIEGDEIADRMISPVLHSGPDVTWAPAGIAYQGGNLYFAGLRGQSLYQLPLDNTTSDSLRAHFFGEYGRLRDVRVGPDGFLYVTTSNQDGRGQVQVGDDKILRIDPAGIQ